MALPVTLHTTYYYLPSDSGKNGSGPSGTNSAPPPRQGAAARREEDTMDGPLSPAEDTPMMETNEERQVISEPVATAAGASARSRSRRRRRR